MRHLLSILVVMFWGTLAFAQETPTPVPSPDRVETGGAQTLEDILRRQRGEEVDDSFRRDKTGNPETAKPSIDQLGTLGGVSDAEMFRALRFGTADVTVSAGGDVAKVLVQDGGMRWLEWRDGPLKFYGIRALLAMILLLALFYMVRGRILIEAGRSARTVERFKAFERFGHWLLAGSFILLAVTGLLLLFGREFLIPLFGPKSFAALALGGKWIHNNVSWAFMLGLVWVFVTWVMHNLPGKLDLKWLAMGGGLFSKGVHPPARKFNAGQKLVFWSVIILGASVSASGLSLLFPFELPMFAKTFGLINDIAGTSFSTQLSPQEDMQFAQLWHSIVAFAMITIIVAHIYLGSVGMEGAYDAMGSGHVDRNWAEEHHGLWVAEEDAKSTPEPKGAPHPAE